VKLDYNELDYNELDYNELDYNELDYNKLDFNELDYNKLDFNELDYNELDYKEYLVITNEFFSPNWSIYYVNQPCYNETRLYRTNSASPKLFNISKFDCN